MGKFKVGDKVRILDAKNIAGAGFDGYENGDILVLIEHLSQLALPGKLTPTPLVLKHSELKYIELVEPFKDQYIESLEKRVETLERLVEDYFKLPVEPSADIKEDKPTKTPNQLRAEIIEKAKGFVEVHLTSNASIASWKNRGCIKGFVNRSKSVCEIPYLTINEQERTVTFVAKGPETGNLLIKTVAKCNPSDVFNEHIGKAIALGRALGLDVSEFEGAVQPTHATGQVCEIKNWYRHNGNLATLKKPFKDKGFYHSYYDGWLGYENFKIINDTNAIYGEVE